MRKNNAPALNTVPAISASLLIVASAIQFGIVRDKFLFEMAACICVSIYLFYMFFTRSFGVPSHFFRSLLGLFLFSLASMVSSMHQGSIAPALNALFFTLAVFSVAGAAYKAGDQTLHIVVAICALSGLILLSLSFLGGFRLYRFSGLFDNPNGMGRYSSILLLLFFLYFSLCRERLSFSARAFLVILCFLLLIALLASNSRGALAALLGSLMAVGFFYFLHFFRGALFALRVNKKFLRGSFGVLFIFLVLFMAIIRFRLHEDLVAKFIATGVGDISQGRFDLWQKGVESFNYFGYADYQKELNMQYDAHNNYIHVVLEFGMVPATFFFLFVIFLGMYFLRRMLRDKYPSLIIGFAVYIHVMIYWSIETGVAIFSVWLMVLLYGISLSHNVAGSRLGLGHD